MSECTICHRVIGEGPSDATTVCCKKCGREVCSACVNDHEVCDWCGADAEPAAFDIRDHDAYGYGYGAAQTILRNCCEDHPERLLAELRAGARRRYADKPLAQAACLLGITEWCHDMHRDVEENY